MLTFPDFKEKQILFIQAEFGVESKIKFSNDNVVFYKDGVVVNRASCSKIFAIFIIGDLSITTGFIKNVIRHGISVFFLKYNFAIYTSINSKSEGNYYLRAKQYYWTKEDELLFAKKLLKNKINNQFHLLKNKKDFEFSNELEKTKEDKFKKVENAQNQKELLGIEGSVSKDFYSLYFKEISWFKRMPRAKPDIPNFLLDMGYVYLFNLVDSLLNLYGFDTYKGFYHKLFFQRKSLSCDIVEPFRCIIDRQLLKSYNLNQIKEKDFKVQKGRYTISYQKSQKYSEIFLNTIIDNKEEIYLFVQGFYRFIMNYQNENRKEFPYFKIKTR